MKVKNNIKNAISIAPGLNIPGSKEVVLTSEQAGILKENKTAQIWIEKGIIAVIEDAIVEPEQAPTKKSKKD